MYILNKFKFKIFPILIILLYVPFHIVEEALNNFPEWMSNQYGLPIILNYPHWLINNLFFFLTLLIGLLFFLKSEKYLYLGIGILLWSLINSFEHIVGTVINSNVSPGFYTGLLFILISIFGILKLINDRRLNTKIVIFSFLSALLYWIIPISLIILTGKFWLKILY